MANISNLIKAMSDGPCVKWTDDVNGKKDYDGRIIDISTRYWPAWKSSNGKPSATAAILVFHGEPDDDGYGSSTDIARKDFEAETEDEVKRLVEEWVRLQFIDIVMRVSQFVKDPVESE